MYIVMYRITENYITYNNYPVITGAHSITSLAIKRTIYLFIDIKDYY